VHGYLTERVDIERTAAVNVDLFLRYFEWNFAAREKIQAGRILDIRYDDLTADSVGTIRRIYDHFGLKFHEGFEARLVKWLAERPQHKFGKHVYAAEDFGMTDAQLAERFKAYTERFLARHD
ncbi:MAG: sulfotransferase, partial [Deltaproteobacteria bacterium]|nr:sulfotransferase [Deltaproteobacteria bacterium]